MLHEAVFFHERITHLALMEIVLEWTKQTMYVCSGLQRRCRWVFKKHCAGQEQHDKEKRKRKRQREKEQKIRDIRRREIKRQEKRQEKIKEKRQREKELKQARIARAAI